MHNAILDMLSRYNCSTVDDYREALKEIIQEIALLGLSRANFFDHAAFYGGTALRIFYGLDRFSEDLDFSLDTADPG
ncbi:MAG: nucleotidyl transferase AbiEii/AbiGii toxin family protein, partial [Anaerolineaceae bacterium]|nr:nucleotidyl transferase AbiEii/AbiGii toxin family protein [Anaerolineaceae bacterium]